MKKVSLKFVLAEIGVSLLVGFIIGLIFCIADDGGFKVDLLLFMTVFIGLMVGLVYSTGLSRPITDKLVKKTIEKNIVEYNFQNCSTFESSNAIIKIDQRTGRIAYVARQNPFEFQVISAKDIDRIKSDYVKGPLGGTSFIYFEFYYNNKKLRFPTFTSSKKMYSMKSARVLEGISKADAFAEILQNAKNAAV